MSEWITDRRPTEEDCKGALGTPYENQVWVNVLGSVVTLDIFHVEAGVAWQPIVIEKPEPYVAPKRYVVVATNDSETSFSVQDRKRISNVSYFIPTREAAERIAAIYNEVMP